MFPLKIMLETFVGKSSRFLSENPEVKFGLSEKHTKFEKIFLMVLTNQLIYLVNIKTMRKIFSNYACFSKSPNFTANTFLQSPNLYRIQR